MRSVLGWGQCGVHCQWCWAVLPDPGAQGYSEALAKPTQGKFVVGEGLSLVPSAPGLAANILD